MWLLVLTLASVTHLGVSVPNPLLSNDLTVKDFERCGVQSPSKKEMDQTERDLHTFRKRTRRQTTVVQDLQVAVKFIHFTDGGQGCVSAASAQAQIAALNNGFKAQSGDVTAVDARVTFTLASQQCVANPTAFTLSGDDRALETQIKATYV